MTTTTGASQRPTGFSRQVDCLRRRLTDWGWPIDEIAAAIGAQFRVRPRAAYRYATGLSGQKAADAYNARFGTADRSAPMSKTRISEYENWPIGQNTRKPSLTVLDNLAQLYGTTRRRLIDYHDWAALSDAVRQALQTGQQIGPQPVHDASHHLLRLEWHASGRRTARQETIPLVYLVLSGHMHFASGRTSDHGRGKSSR
jgi:transcriptional regulator with XRE-family HTH domain